MKIIIVLAFIAILAALGGAGFFMLRKRDGSTSKNMAHALAFRVGISIALFVFLLLAYQMGWISPKGIAPGQ
mgnify:CR=1 FL=1